MSDKIITSKARAFSSEKGAREHRFMVEESGTVRVYDSIARHFTVCHSLTESAMRRIRKLANAA